MPHQNPDFDDVDAACFELAQGPDLSALANGITEELLHQITGSLPEDKQAREDAYHEIRGLARLVNRIHQRAQAYAESIGIDLSQSEPPDEDDADDDYRDLGL